MVEEWPWTYDEVYEETDHTEISDGDASIQQEAVEDGNLGGGGLLRACCVSWDGFLQLFQASVEIGLRTSCESGLHGYDTPCPRETHAKQQSHGSH